MAALKNERRVLLLTVNPCSFPPSAPVPTLEDALKSLKEKFDDGKSRIHLTSDGKLPLWGSHRKPISVEETAAATNALYIADFKLNDEKGVASILVNRGDPDVSDQSFINSMQEDVKNADRPAGYAPGRSAHMVIGYGDDFATKYGHRMILEKANGISRSILFAYFKLLLREWSDEKGLSFKKKKEGDTPYRQYLAHATYASKTLADDLKVGYVTSLELIDTSFEFAGADADDTIKKVSRRLRMSVQKTNEEGKLKQYMDKLRNFGKDANYDEMQVHLSTMQDENASPKFSLEKQDAADLMYARVETISGFEKDLDAAYAKLSGEIESKLFEKLENKEGWPV